MAYYYEDFSIGDEFKSPGRTVTESDVNLFAGLSGDYNPLHTDEEFAKGTIFGTRIAHGLLGLSMVSGLVMRLGVFDGTVIAFLGLEWKFTGPLFIGDTIHFDMKIVEKRETSKADRGIIVREVFLLNQKNEVIQQGTMTIMMKRKSVKLED